MDRVSRTVLASLPPKRPAEIVQLNAEQTEVAIPLEAPTSAPKARKSPIKIAIAASLVIILLIATVFVAAYWSREREREETEREREENRPVLQFENNKYAVYLEISHDVFSGAGAPRAVGTSGWVGFVIYGGGNFTMESIEVRVDDWNLTVTQIYFTPAPPIEHYNRNFSKTIIALSASMKLPANVTVDVDSRVDMSGGKLLKVHIVGSWNLSGFVDRVDLNAETELLWWGPPPY